MELLGRKEVAKNSGMFHDDEFYNLYVHLKKYCYTDEDKEIWRVGM